jgi:two-component system, LuxR family, sensor kinase FixL
LMSPKKFSTYSELEERLRFKTLIADLSSKFVNLPAEDVEKEIMEAQRAICEFLSLDVAGLWQWSDEDGGSFLLSHLFSDVKLQRPERVSAKEYFPWCQLQMLAGRTVVISSIEEFPLEAAIDRETSRHFGIKSSLIIPLSSGRKPPVGVLAFNSTRTEHVWPSELVKHLQQTAEIFTNALARKRSQQALQNSEDLLIVAAESAEAGFWALDCRTGIFWTTDRARVIFGCSPEEVISVESLQRAVHPDDRSLVQKSLERAVRASEPVNVDCRIRVGDGSTRWISFRGRPHSTLAGEMDRVMGISLDITERKRDEEEFRTAKTRLAEATELAALGFSEIDFGESSCFVDERFQEICGLPAGLHSDLHCLQLWIDHLHPDDRQLVLDERQKLIQGRFDRLSLEYRYLHPAGGLKWIHHMARVIGRSATGQALRIFGVIRDITQNRLAEREAQELRDSLMHLTRVNTLGALSGSLAHELNQPLGIILSNAQAAQELLAQQPPDVAEVQTILSDIVAADRRAGEVIKRLRALFRRDEKFRQPLQLNQVIEEILQLSRADLIAKGITVAYELDHGLPLVAGDRVQLQQVILNLVLNAADAMAANASGKRLLTVTTILRQRRAVASVRDKGHGLPADPDLLFQPFYTTKPQGLGLGLAICRSIVEAHGGHLWAESNVERGAVFHIELPIAGVQDKA